MRTPFKNSVKAGCKRCCALLFLFSLFYIPTVVAQEDSSAVIQDSTVAQGENELMKNMKKTGSAMTEEVKKLKEKAAHDQFMGYIYMILGFGAVIVVAWFSTVKAKQYNEKRDAERRKFLENKMANQPKTSHRAPHRKGHRR